MFEYKCFDLILVTTLTWAQGVVWEERGDIWPHSLFILFMRALRNLSKWRFVKYFAIFLSIALSLAYYTIGMRGNSLRRINGWVIQPSSVQIMACRLVDTKPLSEPMLENCKLNAWEKLPWSFIWNSYIFGQENAFVNVVGKMADILFRPQCVRVVLYSKLLLLAA